MQDTFARATHSAYAAGRPSAARDDRVSCIQRGSAQYNYMQDTFARARTRSKLAPRCGPCRAQSARRYRPDVIMSATLGYLVYKQYNYTTALTFYQRYFRLGSKIIHYFNKKNIMRLYLIYVVYHLSQNIITEYFSKEMRGAV